jgi:tetratricopeptide (TPR) repeat protein
MNGDYELNFVKALCYKGKGDRRKALSIMETQILKSDYSLMPYDYLHVGVLKLETDDLTGAIQYLNLQLKHNDFLADTYYYLGLCYKRLNKTTEYRQNMEKAKEFYNKGYIRKDVYTHPMDKVFYVDIEKELQEF